MAQVKELQQVAAEKGVESLKTAATKGVESAGTAAGHAKGFFAEVKAGVASDWAAVASKLGKK